MYLNDHQRTDFYESLGLNTTQFNRHVIIETNKSTERIFPQVPTVDSPEFWDKMEDLKSLNEELVAIGSSDAPEFLKTLQKAPKIERMIATINQMFWMKPVDCGTFDLAATEQLSY